MWVFLTYSGNAVGLYRTVLDSIKHPWKAVAMPKSDDQAKLWQERRAAEFGRAVQNARKAQGISASQLAEVTRTVGYPIHRATIAKIESNSRSGKVDLAEVIVLAQALRVPPVELLYPDLLGGKVEVWPGFESSSFEAVQWFSGEISAAQVGNSPFPGTEDSTNARTALAREYYGAKRSLRQALLWRLESTASPSTAQWDKGTSDVLVQMAKRDLDNVARKVEAAGMESPLIDPDDESES